jgi:hypothetical protein
MKHPRLIINIQENEYNEIGNLNLAKRFNSLFRLVGNLVSSKILTRRFHEPLAHELR